MSHEPRDTFALSGCLADIARAPLRSIRVRLSVLFNGDTVTLIDTLTNDGRHFHAELPHVSGAAVRLFGPLSPPLSFAVPASGGVRLADVVG